MDKIAKDSHRSPSRGFTLVEVMIVVAIVGIIAALAVPEFTGVLNRTRARAQFANVGKHLRDARNTARSTLCEQSVSVDTATNSMRYGPVATTGFCSTLSTFQRVIDVNLVTLNVPTVGGAVTNPVVFNVKGGTPYTEDFVLAATASVDDVGNASFHVWPLVGTVERK